MDAANSQPTSALLKVIEDPYNYWQNGPYQYKTARKICWNADGWFLECGGCWKQWTTTHLNNENEHRHSHCKYRGHNLQRIVLLEHPTAEAVEQDSSEWLIAPNTIPLVNAGGCVCALKQSLEQLLNPNLLTIVADYLLSSRTNYLSEADFLEWLLAKAQIKHETTDGWWSYVGIQLDEKTGLPIYPLQLRFGHQCLGDGDVA